MEVENTKLLYFHLYPKHESFLNEINGDNRSLALRTVLDSVINGNDQLEKQKARRDYLVATSLLILSVAFLLLGLYVLR